MLNRTNDNFLRLLQSKSANLVFESESEYPFNLIEVHAEKEFFFSDYLIKLNVLQEVDKYSFCQDVTNNLQVISNNYIELTELFDALTENCRIIKLVWADFDFFNEFYPGILSFYIVIGQLKSGSFVGFSTKLYEALVDNPSEAEWISVHPDFKVDLTEENLHIIRSFNLINARATFSTATPFFDETWTMPTFGDFVIEFNSDELLLLDKLLHSSRILDVEPLTLESFGWEWEDEEYTIKIRELVDFLNANLSKTKLYSMGFIDCHLYMIGERSPGYFVGLSTIEVGT